MMDKSMGSPPLAATQRLLLRGAGIFLTLLILGSAMGGTPRSATADADQDPYTGTAVVSEFNRLHYTLGAATGALELTRLELRRAQVIMRFSAEYQIVADLAAMVYDAAIGAALDPDLAFRVVKIESNFVPTARSVVGAIGLAQVMPRTAQFYEPAVTVEDLYDPMTNLRIGFAYLRDLLERYDQDIRLALLAYNRGPGRVGDLLARGLDPANGYASSVMSGYPLVGPSLP